MPTDRNAPCPCGSGRKFKKCCLATQQEAAGSWNAVASNLLARTLPLLASFDESVILDTLVGCADVLGPGPEWDPGEIAMALGARILFEAPPDGESDDDDLLDELPVEPLARTWLRRPPRWLTARDRRVLEAGLASAASWWVKETSDDGRPVLRDLLRDGRVARVARAAGPPGSVHLMQIARIDDEDVLLGALPAWIERGGSMRAAVVREDLGSGAALTDDLLREHAAIVRLAFDDARRSPQGPATERPAALYYEWDDFPLACRLPGIPASPPVAEELLAMDQLDVTEERDGLLGRALAGVRRRGTLLELSANAPFTREDLEQVVAPRMAEAGARRIDDAAAAARILDHVAELLPGTVAYALVESVFARLRESLGDERLVEELAERHESGLALPADDVLAAHALPALVFDRSLVFLPGRPRPEGWRRLDRVRDAALRFGWIDEDDAALLDDAAATEMGAWRIDDVHAPGRASVYPVVGEPEFDEPMVALIPFVEDLPWQGLIVGRLVQGAFVDLMPRAIAPGPALDEIVDAIEGEGELDADPESLWLSADEVLREMACAWREGYEISDAARARAALDAPAGGPFTFGPWRKEPGGGWSADVMPSVTDEIIGTIAVGGTRMEVLARGRYAAGELRAIVAAGLAGLARQVSHEAIVHGDVDESE